ncbi:zf-NOSIP domain-containing protein [Haematococcus lacustris]|uniref:Zf-NOSIP domain-containing protein n=1 Tax=Haematococcus lacustris TaxID=44745 RepID=A0A699Z0J9_HAELA|nr:zf-NOSIP domain-containing protein [Haematococcus lacustris]
MQAFWMPGSVPDAEVVVEKPSNDTLCPACNKPLKLKDLVPVRFTKVPGDKEGRHMDPVTKDIFTAATKLVALKPTGDVVALDTWTKDVIELKTGGTGFCARDGDKVVSEKHFALGPGSGRQDLRGQHRSARSLGGLVFMN